MADFIKIVTQKIFLVIMAILVLYHKTNSVEETRRGDG